MERLDLGKQLSSASEQADRPQRKGFTDHDLPEQLIPYPAAGIHGSLTDPGGLTFHNWDA